MKGKLFKKVISIILVVCICLSTVVAVPTTTAQAGFASWLGETLLEFGMQKTCNILSELSERTQYPDFVQSFAYLFVSYEDMHERQIIELCEEILEQLTVVEEKVTEYTHAISTQISQTIAADALHDYSDNWGANVSDVLEDYRVKDAYNQYIRYLLTAMLCSVEETKLESQLDAVNEYLKAYNLPIINESEINEAGVAQAKQKLYEEFVDIIGSESALYDEDAYMNEVFTRCINKLADNLVLEGTSYDKSEKSVVESAATYAFLALPYSHQQYELVRSVANKQVNVISIMHMMYNEYLSMMGEYWSNSSADENWADQAIFSFTYESGKSDNKSYNDLKDDYNELIADASDEMEALFRANIDVDATAYDSSIGQFTTDFGKYMTPEDAVATTIASSDYKDSVSYYDVLDGDLGDIDLTRIENGTDVTYPGYIGKNLKYKRVMAGNTARDVYYILDTTQFDNANANLIGIIDHTTRLKLTADYHFPSCDYVNLVGNYTDGANTYFCPTKDTMQAEMKNLLNTPAFSLNEYSVERYLSNYLPAANSQCTYLLTASRDVNNRKNNISTTYADFYVVDVSDKSDVNFNIDVLEKSGEVLQWDHEGYDHNYSVILANSSNEYLQNLKVEAPNDYNVDIKVVNNEKTGTNAKAVVGEGKTMAIPSGNSISIKFKPSFNECFVSLKLIRNNDLKTETVLIKDLSQLAMFEADADGYYSFDCFMPYSNATIVVETTTDKHLHQFDDNGICPIDGCGFLEPAQLNADGYYEIYNYGQLCWFSALVNGDTSRARIPSQDEQANAIVMADIDCAADWESIGKNTEYSGTFDGNGFVIRDLNADVKKGDEAQPLFDYIGKSAKVQNVILANAYVYQPSVERSGILSNFNNGTISKCVVAESEIYADSASYDVAGITAYNIQDDGVEGVIEYSAVIDTLFKRLGDSGSAAAVSDCNCGNIYSCYSYDCTFENVNEIGPICNYIDCGKYCYYYIEQELDYEVYGKAKTVNNFQNGNVAYNLNLSCLDEHVWYQNLDNGLEPDLLPHFNNNGENKVYKVVRGEDKKYSNYPDGYKPSVITQQEVRTYQRKPTATNEINHYILQGFALVDNDTKTITLLATESINGGRYVVSLLKNQGFQGKAGVMTLLGDYPVSEYTKYQIWGEHLPEDDIYTDANGMIIMYMPDDKYEMELKVSYKQHDEGNIEYSPTEYTVRIIKGSPDNPILSGIQFVDGMIQTPTSTDPDVGVVEDFNKYVIGQQTTVVPESTVKSPQTGAVTGGAGAVLALGMGLALITLKRKKIK